MVNLRSLTAALTTAASVAVRISAQGSKRIIDTTAAGSTGFCSNGQILHLLSARTIIHNSRKGREKKWQRLGDCAHVCVALLNI